MTLKYTRGRCFLKQLFFQRPAHLLSIAVTCGCGLSDRTQKVLCMIEILRLLLSLSCLHCLRFVICPSAWRRCWSDTSWLTTPIAPWQNASFATRNLLEMTTSKCTWKTSMVKPTANCGMREKKGSHAPKCSICMCTNPRLLTWLVSQEKQGLCVHKLFFPTFSFFF